MIKQCEHARVKKEILKSVESYTTEKATCMYGIWLLVGLVRSLNVIFLIASSCGDFSDLTRPTTNNITYLNRLFLWYMSL